MDTKNREKKLVINTLILSVGTLFSGVFSFVMVPFYTRWLTPADYGAYDLFMTLVMLLQPVVTLSCGEACFRFLLDRDENTDPGKVISTSLTVALVGILTGCAVLVFVLLMGYRDNLFAFLCMLVSYVFFTQAGFIARGLRNPVAYTLSHIIYLVGMAVTVTILVFFMKMGADGMLYGATAGYTLGFLYVVFSCKLPGIIRGSKPDLTITKEMIRYSFPLIPNTISWWIVGVSDRSLVSFFLGAGANGIYAIANKLPSLCSSVFGVFHLSWQESASDAMSDKDRNVYFNSIFNQIVPMCCCVCMGVLSINRYMYRWIWDPRYTSGYYHVLILITAAAFSFMAQFLGGILIADKQTKVNGVTTIIAAVVNMVINFALIQVIGLYAASFSTLASYLVLFAIRIIYINKKITIRLNKNAYAAIGCYLLVAVTQFLSGEIIGITAIVFSVIVTLLLNKNLVQAVLKKILKRG